MLKTELEGRYRRFQSFLGGRGWKGGEIAPLSKVECIFNLGKKNVDHELNLGKNGFSLRTDLTDNINT